MRTQIPSQHRLFGPTRRVVAALFAALTLAGGCTRLPEASARVVLTEMAIAVPRDHALGTTAWEVANTGAAHHSLSVCVGDRGRCAVEPVTLQVLRKPADARDPGSLPDQTTALVLGSGWDALVEVDLHPGRYRLFCGVPNHAAKGMEAVIRVR
jgi:hypothetical protein